MLGRLDIPLFGSFDAGSHATRASFDDADCFAVRSLGCVAAQILCSLDARLDVHTRFDAARFHDARFDIWSLG